MFTLVDRLSPMTRMGTTRWEPGTSLQASRRLVHVHTVKGGALYRPWLG